MMLYQIKRSDEEISQLLNEAAEAEERGTEYPAATYEQGITYALEWLFGDSDDYPM